MTKGSPAKLITAFMLPMLGSYAAQQLYTIVDSIIVGQGVGVDALASIGATDMLRNVAVWGMSGITAGFAVLLTILYGEKDLDAFRQCKQNAVYLSFLISAVLAVIGSVFSGIFMDLANVPHEIFGQAQRYMMIIYAGCPALMMYYIGSAVLRSLGNSRVPFIAIIASSVTNIVLDMIFVFVFEWGLEGAAAATDISQVVSGSVCFVQIGKIRFLKSGKKGFRRDRHWVGSLLKKGVPMGIEDGFIAVGGAVLQAAVNGCGVSIVAGFTATNKIYMLMEGAAAAIGDAMVTYVGQNAGAGYMERVSRGVRNALLLALVISAAVSGILIVSGKYLLMMFIDSDAADSGEILDVGYHYLVIICIFLYLLYLVHLYRKSIMGLGNTTVPMASGAGEFVGRVGTALLLTKLWGSEALYFGEVLAFIGADIVLIPMYYAIFGRLKRIERSERKLY